MRTTLRRLAHTAVHPRLSGTEPGPYSWLNTAEAGPSRPKGTTSLSGKKIAIKENISYGPAPTSCSSRILEGYRPPFDATCVRLLLDEGAQIVGQTKMDEFGMGSLTTHLPPGYTPVYNPSGPAGDSSGIARSAGGSSGGSAAAVAEGSCWAALGTDTGGSVRLPASYCGVVGLKPSYGMISRYGIVAYADSLDCVGILARDVDAVSCVLSAVSVPDDRDMTCATSSIRRIAKDAVDAQHPTRRPDSLNGLRIGIPVQTHLSSPRIQLPPTLLENLQSLGATLQAVSLPNLGMALPAYYVLASAEASSNLARYGGGWYGSTWERDERKVGGEGGRHETGLERRRRVRTEGFGKEVKKRILAGTHALSADEFNNTYLKALHLRHLLQSDFARLFRTAHPLHSRPAIPPPKNGIDLLLHPTAISTAPALPSAGDRAAVAGGSEYMQDLLTVPASLAGLPAMSVPAGRGEDGWPVGVSLVGQWGMEEVVMWAGRAIEAWKGI